MTRSFGVFASFAFLLSIVSEVFLNGTVASIAQVIFLIIGFASLGWWFKRLSGEKNTLYGVNIPWGFTTKHSTSLAPKLNRYSNEVAQYLNERKWQMVHQPGDGYPEKEYQLVTERLHKSHLKNGFLKGFWEYSDNHQEVGEVLDLRSKRLGKETPQLTSTLANRTPQNIIAVPNADASDKNASRGAEALAFYEELAKDYPPVKELPTAAKRWSSMSRGDRDNLIVIMEELSEAREVVTEAKTLGRSRMLQQAEKGMLDNITLGEQVAASINNALDGARLDTISSSSIFLRDKFHYQEMSLNK